MTYRHSTMSRSEAAVEPAAPRLYLLSTSRRPEPPGRPVGEPASTNPTGGSSGIPPGQTSQQNASSSAESHRTLPPPPMAVTSPRPGNGSQFADSHFGREKEWGRRAADTAGIAIGS